jgi:alpha-L-fucosidase
MAEFATGGLSVETPVDLDARAIHPAVPGPRLGRRCGEDQENLFGGAPVTRALDTARRPQPKDPPDTVCCDQTWIVLEEVIMRLWLCTAVLLIASQLALDAQIAPDLGRAEWYRPPKLTVMMGFIKDPEHKQFTVKEWAKGIGSKFDPAALVERAHRAGVTQIIWYDKWIDGLVFRRTKTTGYTTERDFLAALAPECRKRGIKLVIYFNTFYDGNPEFAQWAARDQTGKAISFAPVWPENLLSIYSPFREKALEQIRELVVDYGVDGLYLDVPAYALVSYDQWTREAFRKRMHKDVDDATLEERRRFAIESAVGWNQEVAEFVHKLNPKVTIATNELIDPVVEGPARATGMSKVVDYFTTELHTTDLQINRGPTLGNALKPYEIVTLISDDWFTPLRSGPVKTSKSADQMHVELASIFTAGLNLCLAITFAHDGTLDENTLKHIDLAGEWLRRRRPYLENAEDMNDVGIMLGTPDAESLDWPGGGLYGATRVNGGNGNSYDAEIMKIERSLRQNGYLPRRLIHNLPCRALSSIPAGMRALILPDRAQTTARDREMIEAFARAGGSVIAFGRGGMLAPVSGTEPTKAAGMFGVNGSGYGAVGFQVVIGDNRLSVTGPALHLHGGSAETIIWGNESRIGAFPFLTRNGAAYLIAASERQLGDTPRILDRIWKEAIGQPIYRVLSNPERYTVRVRIVNGKRIVHIIDSPTAKDGPMGRYRALYTKLSLNARIIPFTKATIVPDGRAVDIVRDGDWATLELFPDPELTIVLE